MNSDLSLAAQRGWKIFPLVHSSHFAVSQPLLHDATSNETQIEHWENIYPECNWAVATGEESGVFVIKFSLDDGLATVREFGERDPDISRTLQVRRPNELLAFLEWPAARSSILTCGMTAPGARLLGEKSYAPIPGPGMQIHLHCEYVDREAPVLAASEWLVERIHQGGHRYGGVQLLAFNPLPNVAHCVLLRFERKGNRWFCDFYEPSGVVRICETLIYRSSETVVSLATRGGAIINYENRVRLYREMKIGNGSVLLNLTSEQYNKLIAA
ncbi:bifunctional DNA primase/polymerase [Granulicella sp. L60]|uniref:bifunctional DNA primase/polymerase n=1 Tax=Granulicella sp. L60 TaxID=1641866 RepID=UPI00131B26AC|nr:bifunctional DNA primase/polymerase [Granulicella sp. L60]